MNRRGIQTVLLIEDNPGDARLLREMFNEEVSSNTDFTHVAYMSDAEKHLSAHKVDIILLDLGLPDAEGLEAVRRAHIAAPHTPLVVLTGLDDESLALRTLQAGAQDYLLKGQIATRGLMRAFRHSIERKVMEEALFAEKERAQVTLKCIGDAVVCADLTGRITFLNLAAQAMTGWSFPAAGGRVVDDVLRIVDAASRDCTPDPMKMALRECRTVHLPANCILIRQDASELWIEGSIAPIRDREGEAVGAVVVLSDVTASRIAAMEIAERSLSFARLADELSVESARRHRTEARFRLVVEAAPNAMLMTDGLGHIEMANAQAEKIFGYDRGDLLSQELETLVPALAQGNHPGLGTKLLADSTLQQLGAEQELFGLRKDGSEFPIEMGLNPIETEDGTIIISAILDISDRRHKEAHLQMLAREKDVLLAEIHHRVKNNLQIIHSLLEMQSERITDPTVLDLLRDSQTRISSMALIHQVLYQSKNFSGVDFRVVLESLVPNLIDSYSGRGQQIFVELTADNVHLPLNAAIPCGLIVSELISNVLKHAYSDNCAGTIRVGLTQLPENWVLLCIADDGKGISEGFDLQQTATLGLQLIHLLTDQLGGQLTIQRSMPTSFTIRFPEDRSSRLALAS